MSPSSRATESLKRKQAALKAVVEPWLNANHVNKKFPRMSSQTSAAVNLLTGLLAGIDEDIKAGELQAETQENRILAGYQFWNVFRSKFAQRLQSDLERFLKAADELAWLCYLPARNAALGADDPRRKEPPLVYFSSEASPFVDPRGDRFQPEGIPAYVIESYGWPEASRKLPFAMIGVPWFQTGFLPGALAIAHEAGHSVEGDFGLGNSLKQSMAKALAGSMEAKESWQNWSGEMFADLWGCLALGPSFIRALADTLWPRYQADPTSQSKEYPPPPLRMWWNSSVLELMGFAIPMAEIWPEENKPEQSSRDDAKRIAEAWMANSFAELGNHKLGEVLNFTEEQKLIAQDQAKSAKAGKADQSSDVRALWAAIQTAWKQPATELLLDRILVACNSAVRKREVGPGVDLAEKRRAEYVRKSAREFL